MFQPCVLSHVLGQLSPNLFALPFRECGNEAVISTARIVVDDRDDVDFRTEGADLRLTLRRLLPEGRPLRRHVLYRLRRPGREAQVKIN